MTTRVVPAGAYRRVRWKNSLGWTSEIALGRLPMAAPDRDETSSLADGEWDWRLSIAEIDRDCAFSSFPGIDRTLVLLEGPGMHLRFAEGEKVLLAQPLQRIDFAGERALDCELIAGPTRDFNAMWRRDRVRARIECASLQSRMTLSIDPDSVAAVHVVSGGVSALDNSDESAVPPGDTAVFESRNERELALIGNGDILIIRFHPYRPD